MEGILFIIALILAPVLIRVFFRGASAVGKTAVGKGSLSDNMNLEFKGMPDFSIQLSKKSSGDDDMPFERYEILGKGLFPNKSKTELNFVTRIIDNTDKDKPMPIMSSVEEFQAEGNPYFELERKGPEVDRDYGFIKPTVVGFVIPEILIPPKSGTRDILFILIIYDRTGNELGSYNATQKIIFEEEGYEEAYETREEIFLLDIQLAVHVAFSDNEFHKTEGELIKNWMVKILEIYDGEEKESLKKRFNETFKESYKQAKTGDLSLSKITKRFNEIGNDQLKYQAIQLCLDVMAADGIADEGELQDIRQICDSLELDYDVVQKLKDVRLKDVKMRVTSDTSLEELVGIKTEWDKEQINKHLRNEFSKWNSRLNSSKDQNERDNAQEKLDIIADLRKKYG